MEMLKDGLEILNPQVTEVIIHPRYVEASSSGFDIAVYKVASIYYVMDRQVQGVFKSIKNPIFGFFLISSLKTNLEFLYAMMYFEISLTISIKLYSFEVYVVKISALKLHKTGKLLIWDNLLRAPYNCIIINFIS